MKKLAVLITFLIVVSFVSEALAASVLDELEALAIQIPSYAESDGVLGAFQAEIRNLDGNVSKGSGGENNMTIYMYNQNTESYARRLIMETSGRPDPTQADIERAKDMLWKVVDSKEVRKNKMKYLHEWYVHEYERYHNQAI